MILATQHDGGGRDGASDNVFLLRCTQPSDPGAAIVSRDLGLGESPMKRREFIRLIGNTARPTVEWNETDYDVVGEGPPLGRISTMSNLSRLLARRVDGIFLSKHDIAVLAALGLLDPNDLLRAVDVLDLQPVHLSLRTRRPSPGSAIASADDPVAQTRTPCRPLRVATPRSVGQLDRRRDLIASKTR